jgi:hypothetical protein
MPSVVVGFACPMKRLISNGGMPVACSLILSSAAPLLLVETIVGYEPLDVVV